MVALALALGMAAGAVAVEGQDTTFQVVRPTDEEHKLLPKTCRVCHREGDLHFIIVASPSPAGLEAAEDRLFQSSGEVRTAKVRANPHAKIVCLFCHMSQPQKGEDSAQMTFRTANSEPVGRDGVEQMCKLCHPELKNQHKQVVTSAAQGSDLVTAGIIQEGQSLRCSSCHEMHSPNAGPAVVSEPFMVFAENSIHLMPHGNRAGCRACHPREVDANTTKAVFLDASPVKRCERCHPDIHAKIHRAGGKSTDKTFPMDFLDFPLANDGTMHCSTCHDEPCNAPIDPINPAFLREGPYRPPTDFCYRCHPRGGEGSLSPHRQVDEEGNVLQSACVFCHLDIETDSKKLAFLHSPIELCMNCHDVPPHPTGINHLVEMPEKSATKLQDYEKRHEVHMPLDEHGQIVCTTCHNPHDKGVLEGKLALGAGEEGKYRVPSFAELCTPCHARYD